MQNENRIGEMIQKEIINSKISSREEKIGFIYGMIIGSGFLFNNKSKKGIIIQSTSIDLIDKCSSLIENLIDISPTVYQNEVDSSIIDKTIYVLELAEEDAINLLSHTGIVKNTLDVVNSVNPKIIESVNAKKSFLQGLYSSAGAIYVPDDKEKNSSGYSLEITLKNIDIAKDVVEILKYFDIPAKVRNLNNNGLLYMKDANEIADFIAIINALNSYFSLHNTMAYRDIKNDANRERNCIMANTSKAASASAKQLYAINVIRKNKTFEELDEKLQSTAIAREEYPELTLSELINYIPDRPSKSGLAHRMKKIIQIAEDIENN